MPEQGKVVGASIHRTVFPQLLCHSSVSPDMTRTKPTDLGDGVAEAIFRLHVPLDLSPKTLWQYEMKNGKARVQWANIMKARPLLRSAR